MMLKNTIQFTDKFIKDIKCECCKNKAEYYLKAVGILAVRDGYFCHEHYSAFVNNKLDI